MSSLNRFVTLGEISDRIGDGLHGTPAYSENGEYFFINGNNLLDGEIIFNEKTKSCSKFEYDKYKKDLSNNTILISINGTIGNLAFYKGENVILGKSACYINIKSDVDKNFIYYALKSSKFQNYIKSQATGSTIKNVSLKLLRDYVLELPDIIQQKRISKILSTLDDKIHLNDQLNQTLESIAQAIFKSWFIDFEPVRAKIAAKQEGKDPERAAMCAISGKSEAELEQMAKEDFAELQATAALFPDDLIESELGEVPRGWEVNSLGNICNFTPGSAFKPEYQGQTHGEIPFIKVSDMNLNGNEIFIVKANNYIDSSLQKERKFKLHEEGATVFAKIGVALISNRRRVLTMPTIIDNNMMSASPLKGLSTPYYLYLLFKTIDFNTLVSGTALPYLNVSDLRKILIVHPTINLLNKFELIANPLLQKIKLNSVQCEGLVTLRDNLLPKLLSGEIDASVLNGEHG